MKLLDRAHLIAWLLIALVVAWFLPQLASYVGYEPVDEPYSKLIRAAGIEVVLSALIGWLKPLRWPGFKVEIRSVIIASVAALALNPPVSKLLAAWLILLVFAVIGTRVGSMEKITDPFNSKP